MTWLAVGLGGALGAMLRHGLGSLVTRLWPGGTFPMGIFAINVLGSGVMGLLAGALAGGKIALSYEWRVFLAVGILGGFTTFSSFSLDTLTLMRAGHLTTAVANVVGQVGLGLVAIVVCYRIGSSLP